MGPMKFHEFFNLNVELSRDRTAARRVAKNVRTLCFTERSLAPKEALILTLSADRDADAKAALPMRYDPASHFFLGVTRESPYTILEGNPVGGIARRTAHFEVRGEREEFRIYLDELHNGVVLEVRRFGVMKTVPVTFRERPCLIFAFSGRMSNLKIESVDFEPISVRTFSCPIKNHRLGNVALAPAFLDSSAKREFTFEANVAVSNNSIPSKGNHAFVDAPFTSGSVLFVELTLMKSIKPVLIVLTTENAHTVLEYDSLKELCHRTYSHMMTIEPPGAMDVVGLRISPHGVVYSSVNNQDWIKQVDVDPRSTYHVIFAMECISVLTVIGIATGLNDID